jgi:hypothetical protein
MMMDKKPTFTLVLVLLFTLSHPSLSMAQTRCLKLNAVEDQAIAYRDRGNRCEGFYESQVSVGSLSLVGLLIGKLDFDSKKNSMLSISSPSIRNQEVHVQAVGIPMKTYYRLDAWLQPGESLEWPLDIIKKKRLSSDHIGLFGQLVAEPTLYVPLTLLDESTGTSPTVLTLTLRASVNVGAVQWRKVSLHGQKCGDMSKAVWQSIAPAWGDYFYSGEAITLELPQQHKNFCIEFATRQEGTGTWLKLQPPFVKIRMED